MAEVTNVHATRCGSRNQMKAVIATIDGATYTLVKTFAGDVSSTNLTRTVYVRGCPQERRIPFSAHYERITAVFRALPEFATLASLEA